MDVYTTVNEKIINLLEAGVVTWAETVDLRRIAAQSYKEEALSRRECISAFCLEICFTVLVDTPPS